MKITMLGTTGVGKTTFMAAMYYELGRKGRNGFSLVADLDLDRNLGAIWQAMTLAGQWPASTTRYDRMQFLLRYANKTVMEFEFVDYRGGAVVGTSTDSDVQNLFKDLDESDSVMILVDSWYIINSDMEIAEQQNEVFRILNLIERFFETKPNKFLSFAVVLTKYDAVPEGQQKEFGKRCLTLFSRLISIVERNRNQLRATFVPVSVTGSGRAVMSANPVEGSFVPMVVTKMLKSPQPLNVHWPLFYCVGKQLEYQERVSHLRLEQITQEMVQALSKSSIVNDIWSWVTNVESHSLKAKNRAQQSEEYRVAVQRLRSNLKPLLDEIEHLPDILGGRIHLP